MNFNLFPGRPEQTHFRMSRSRETEGSVRKVACLSYLSSRPCRCNPRDQLHGADKNRLDKPTFANRTNEKKLKPRSWRVTSTRGFLV